jgi:Ala-tRNA(Pro) deacylase
MARDTFERIVSLLRGKGIAFEHLTHEHVHHSEDAAKIRGNSVSQAAKALVLEEQPSGGIVMFVVGGDRRLDLSLIKKEILRVKNVSLAHPDRVLAATGCTIGSVPPFGNLFNVSVYLDAHLLSTQDEIVFSAGTHHDSIRMKTTDYVAAVGPVVAGFSKEKTAS